MLKRIFLALSIFIVSCGGSDSHLHDSGKKGGSFSTSDLSTLSQDYIDSSQMSSDIPKVIYLLDLAMHEGDLTRTQIEKDWIGKFKAAKNAFQFMKTMHHFVSEIRKIRAKRKSKLRIDPKKKSSLRDALLTIVKKKEFLFLGETHGVNDLAEVAPLLDDLKKIGLTKILLEFPPSTNKALNEYLRTGDKSHFKNPYDLTFRLVNGELKNILSKAKSLGLGVSGIMPDDTTPRLRELKAAIEILKLPKVGKKLVILGSAHVGLGENEISTVRKLVANKRTTGAIVFENRTAIMKMNNSNKIPFSGEHSMNAFYEVYARLSKDKNPDEIFAYPTAEMGNFKKFDTFARAPGKWISYRDNFDYVVFQNKVLTEYLRRGDSSRFAPRFNP